MLKALLSMLLGLWIAGIGIDLFSDTSRFTFGQLELLSGVDELRRTNRTLTNEVNELNRSIEQLKRLDQELENKRR